MDLHERRIAEANIYLNQYRDKISQSQYRQNYHFCTPVGWLNDPNGFIQYRGEYHLFYQFHPYKPYWGAMYWGHAKSKDLIHWEHLPVALAPSEAYDDHEKGGCFSGTAIEKDGRLYIFYTGTALQGEKMIQTQCLAISEDGVKLTKYAGNPIIEADYPGVTPENFRDPKVWEHNGRYHMIVGTSISGRGNALHYTSDNLMDWELSGPFVDYQGNYGTMWECPDFFRIGEKAVLLFSPMGLGETTTLYLIGTIDDATGKFRIESEEVIDFGFDFYAPQSILDHQGRRIMMAWQNGWEWMPWWRDFGPTSEMDQWCGAMSLPREVTLTGSQLGFRPIQEISQYMKNQYLFQEIFVWKEERLLTAEMSESYMLELDRTDLQGTLTLTIKNEQGVADQIVCSRTRVEYFNDNNPFGKTGKSMVTADNEPLLLYSDSCSLEIFGVESGKMFSVNNFMKKGKRIITVTSDSPNTIIRLNLREIRN